MRIRHWAIGFLSAVCSTAYSGGYTEFCAEAQQLIVTTQLPVTNSVHTDYDGFVKSKPSVDPLTTHQYLALDAEGQPRNLSCKLKSADHIIDLDPEAQATGNDCRALHQRLLDEVIAELRAEGASIGFDNGNGVVMDESAMAGMGPDWLSEYPYPALYTSNGMLHLRAKSMYVSWYSWAPIPARFKGTYYCHLVAPEYLKSVLSGAEPAPAG